MELVLTLGLELELAWSGWVCIFGLLTAGMRQYTQKEGAGMHTIYR